MSHLTEDQLSAFLDGALPASERATCEAHLAGCDACRARLAEASALDASLGRALTHDPGEAYFADFADRVGKRIAAEPRPLDAAPEAPKVPKSAEKSFWSWLSTPRGLALAGSTAALLVTAGIAWLQFHSERVPMNAQRLMAPGPVGTRVHKQSAPGASDEALPAPPAASAPAQPPPQNQARPFAAAPTRELDHMREVRTLPNGEQAPVSGGASPPQGSALAAPATGSTIAQMKKRAVAPAGEAGAVQGLKEKEGMAPSADAQRTSKDAASLARNEAPAPATTAPVPAAARFAQEPVAKEQKSLALTSATSRAKSSTWDSLKPLVLGGRPDEVQLDANKLEVIAHCGKVRDGLGRVVAGAQVTAVHDGVRTARTGPDGSFCVDGLAAGDTLTVMHVGFDPYTVVMTPMTSLAITLQPVGTLGPQSTMLLGKSRVSSPSLGGPHPMASESAPAPDVYASLSSGVRHLVSDAREATAVARRERTAPSFESAAKQWATVAGQVKGAAADDARFQYVSALREAYQLEATTDRATRLRSAYAAFLAVAPDSLPERVTVVRWQKELGASPDH